MKNMPVRLVIGSCITILKRLNVGQLISRDHLQGNQNPHDQEDFLKKPLNTQPIE